MYVFTETVLVEAPAVPVGSANELFDAANVTFIDELNNERRFVSRLEVLNEHRDATSKRMEMRREGERKKRNTNQTTRGLCRTSSRIRSTQQMLRSQAECSISHIRQERTTWIVGSMRKIPQR